VNLLWLEDDLDQIDVLIDELQERGHVIQVFRSVSELERECERNGAIAGVLIIDSMVPDGRDARPRSGRSAEAGLAYLEELLLARKVKGCVLVLTFFVPSPERRNALNSYGIPIAFHDKNALTLKAGVDLIEEFAKSCKMPEREPRAEAANAS
jgi:hypothetical protein